MNHLRRISMGQFGDAIELCRQKGFVVHEEGVVFRTILDACRNEVTSLVGGQTSERAHRFDRDVQLGLALRLALRGFTVRALSDLGVWRFLAIRTVPDIIIERDPDAGEKQFAGPIHCYPLRCWRFIDLCWQSSFTESDSVRATWAALQGLSTDAISALVERPGSGDYAGYRRDVSRELIRQFQFVEQRRQKREAQFRKAVKLCGARMLLEEPVLCDGGIPGFITSVLSQLGFNLDPRLSVAIRPDSSKDALGAELATLAPAGAWPMAPSIVATKVPPRVASQALARVAVRPLKKPSPRPVAKAGTKVAARAGAKATANGAAKPVASTSTKPSARASGKRTAKASAKLAARASSRPLAKSPASPKGKIAARAAPRASLAERIRKRLRERQRVIDWCVDHLTKWLSRQEEPKSKIELLDRVADHVSKALSELSREDFSWLWDRGLRVALQNHDALCVSGTTRWARYSAR